MSEFWLDDNKKIWQYLSLQLERFHSLNSLSEISIFCYYFLHYNWANYAWLSNEWQSFFRVIVYVAFLSDFYSIVEQLMLIQFLGRINLLQATIKIIFSAL